MNDIKAQIDAMNAIEKLISSFSKYDKKEYFSAFSNDATFLFYNQERLLTSKAEYEAQWSKWEREGQFEVLSCSSSNRNLQVIDNVAIFTHWISIEVGFESGNDISNERETIVLHKNDSGCWLAVHLHLSVASL